MEFFAQDGLFFAVTSFKINKFMHHGSTVALKDAFKKSFPHILLDIFCKVFDVVGKDVVNTTYTDYKDAHRLKAEISPYQSPFYFTMCLSCLLGVAWFFLILSIFFYSW